MSTDEQKVILPAAGRSRGVIEDSRELRFFSKIAKATSLGRIEERKAV
jgi:hypothetical protein